MAALHVMSEPSVALAQGCQGGEEQDQFTMTCVPFMVPNSPPLFQTTAANPDVPEIQGIPCIGHNAGACLGLAEDEAAAGPPAQPRSTISASP
ncbi:intersectin-EH binding protein Ibp1 [Mycolicibacterium flavescens]|nr:intersectin-EH binding protein Ibp1 [Mycolicibacterium flavescens]